MSDGPHRSLPMSRKWKRFAERIYNEAFGPEQAYEALLTALSEDWRNQIPRSLVNRVQNVLSDGQTELFCNQIIEKLDSLRQEVAGYPLAGVLLDYVCQTLGRGIPGENALLEAARQLLTDRLARRARQVEEHCHSEATCNRATDIRRRIEDAISGLNLAATACDLLGIAENEPPRILAKQAGLDDGVLL